jgi:hypothetical protein
VHAHVNAYFSMVDVGNNAKVADAVLWELRATWAYGVVTLLLTFKQSLTCLACCACRSFPIPFLQCRINLLVHLLPTVARAVLVLSLPIRSSVTPLSQGCTHHIHRETALNKAFGGLNVCKHITSTGSATVGRISAVFVVALLSLASI